ncbi:MAG: signal peptidase I [Clostridiaceae bacterium]|nr:signal peptidase I [Bacillota bacterium]NLI38068.1 signal peptidase I [Clostridiaceae bacterium]
MTKKKIIHEIFSWLLVILIPLVLVFFLNMKVFAISVVDQYSMNNTLFKGELVYYNRINYNINTIERGDIILFLADGKIKDGFFGELAIKVQDFMDNFRKESQRTNKRFVKRVIGVPGDVIDIHDGQVYVNGVKESGDYVLGTTPPFSGEYPLTVPPGKLFVMGDNREISKDSRSFGCIDVHSVEGKAVMIIWPLSRIGKPQ